MPNERTPLKEARDDAAEPTSRWAEGAKVQEKMSCHSVERPKALASAWYSVCILWALAVGASVTARMQFSTRLSAVGEQVRINDEKLQANLQQAADFKNASPRDGRKKQQVKTTPGKLPMLKFEPQALAEGSGEAGAASAAAMGKGKGPAPANSARLSAIAGGRSSGAGLALAQTPAGEPSEFAAGSDAAAIVDNADGTGTLGGEPLTCTYSPEAGGSAVPCGDGMSFETDLCADKGRCSEAAQLPCGLELAVDYPGGLVLGVSGDRNPAAAGTVRTRHCGPPRLLPSTASPAGSELPLTWSEPVDMSDASARLWLCELDTLEQKCHIKGEPIGDVVEQGEDPSKWTLRLPEGARPACGRLEVLLEAEAARSRANPVSSQKTRTEFATQGDCPQFLDPMETGCWLLWDLAYRFMGTRGPTGGSDNVHFRKDLDDIGVIYTVKSRAEELWDRLEAKTYMPWCLIIPGLKEDPAEGRERAFFDYVGMGGQLYVIGGRVNVDFLHSVFDIEMSLAFSGNRQILESDSLNSTLRGSGWFQELPTLNQMACVSFPAMQGTRFGEGVVVHGIYSGREEVSDTEQLNGYCLFEVMASQGVAEYLAFDWHVDDDSARKKWATTLALLLEGNRARRPRGARRLGEAVPPAAAPGPGGRGRYPLVAAEDLPRFSRRLAAAGRPRRLAGAGCPQAEGEGRDFELTVALRCSPEQDGTEYLDAGT
ncbi:unnamed protein product, partial [Prorocentrum cordatum]